MELKHTYWGSMEADTDQPVVINPAQVRFLRGTVERQTEVWFAADHCVKIIADHLTAEKMFDPEDGD